MPAPVQVGGTVRLRGVTLRGKNRVARGGESWLVVRHCAKWGFFLVSASVGERECFWATLPNDPNVATSFTPVTVIPDRVSRSSTRTKEATCPA